MLSETEERALRALLSEPRLAANELPLLRALMQESRQIGSKALLRRLFHKVYDETISVPTGGPHATGPIETQEDLQHAFYLLSAKRADITGEETLYAGTVAVFPANSVTVAIARRYNTGPPTKIDTYLECYNNKGSTVAIQVKVYRVPGLI